MHELSVITSVIETVDKYLEGAGGAAPCGDAAGSPVAGVGSAARVTRIALQVGKHSSYIPGCIREIWPYAVKETSLGSAVLEIEDIAGRDFLIKEIEIEE
ncbi:MAG: hydrogenase maturation nickel metallochaperone HypA [Clostridiales Family XIII bacterium]|jgi:Zn finger protein HypA/HybF involved in hydrogenase expression|nr:hydrogenase maturation nickel metallochaperone HypA [Clostridiales Family XIII bacterium]